MKHVRSVTQYRHRTVLFLVQLLVTSVIGVKTGVSIRNIKLIAILRRQFCMILTASWKKIYSVLGGVFYHDLIVLRAKQTQN